MKLTLLDDFCQNQCNATFKAFFFVTFNPQTPLRINKRLFITITI